MGHDIPELYLLLFSGQGYQYPLIEQIVLEHMNRKRDAEIHQDNGLVQHNMVVIPNREKGLSFELKDCVIAGASLMTIRPEFFNFLTRQQGVA